jgi:hypothetical protein
MKDKGKKYWEPRVMRHSKGSSEEYAIHEVYFDEDGNVDGYTMDTLSPVAPSIEALRAALLSLLQQGEEEIVSGELGYTYEREEIEDWLECLNAPAIDYEGEGVAGDEMRRLFS